jgi:RNA polymerase sigma-70 factor (ECF subfamily)
MTPAHGDGSFPKTRWTLVRRLRSDDEAVVGPALEELCAQYHYPLYCYIRRSGLSHADAQDALHDFLAKLLRAGTFAEANAEKGRLRTFLITSLQRFLINWHRDETRRRRDIVDPIVSPEAAPEERYLRERFADDETPERIFERKWGHALIHQVLQRLEAAYDSRGRTAVFAALRPVLLGGGSLRGENSATIAAALGLSEGALRAALSRLLHDFRETLQSEVLVTVSSPAEAREEISYLQSLFQRA